MAYFNSLVFFHRNKLSFLGFLTNLKVILQVAKITKITVEILQVKLTTLYHFQQERIERNVSSKLH